MTARRIGLPILVSLLAALLFGALFQAQASALQQDSDGATVADNTEEVVVETEEMTVTLPMTGASATVTDTDTVTPTEMITLAERMTATPSDTLIQLGENRITPAEFDRAFVRAVRMFANQQGIPINEMSLFFFADLRSRYLNQFTTEQVLLAEAERRGIEISEDEALDLIQPLKMDFLSDEAYQQALNMAGYADEGELIEFVRQDAALNAVLTELVADIEVTEEEIRDFYTDTRELFRVGPGVILYEEQVEDEIRQLLRQQKLQGRIAELGREQSVAVYTGNLTPFDDLLASGFQMATPITTTAGITVSAEALMTDTVESGIAEPESITTTAGITVSAEALMTDTVESEIAESDTVTESDVIDVVPENEIPPAAVPEMVDLDVMSVDVQDQAIVAGVVIVDRVVMVGPGWLVIHADDNGAPGEVLGYEMVDDGINEELVVRIETADPGDGLWAMLHDDTGEAGVYEFPDADPPAEADGETVMTFFAVLDAE